MGEHTAPVVQTVLARIRENAAVDVAGGDLPARSLTTLVYVGRHR